MFSIECEGIRKRYLKEVLFKDFNFTFEQGNSYAILGYNSSGKSTLLKIVAGILTPTKGSIQFSEGEPHTEISFCSPELYLLEDYTVKELIDFHYQFRQPKISIKEQIKEAALQPFLNKKYSTLSSGLKNKVKLALALFSDTPALLLDEPCTNFDDSNTKWYQEMIKKYCLNQLLIVASNQTSEYNFCKEEIHLQDFK